MLVPMRADIQGQRARLPFKGVSFRLILDSCFLIPAHTHIESPGVEFASCFSSKPKKKKKIL